MANKTEGSPADAFAVDFEKDPHLVLGWRPMTRRLAAGRVPLRDDVFESLRQVAREALARLGSSRSRSYEPAAELEESEEHFVVPIGDLPPPQRPPRRQRSARTETGTANEAGAGTDEHPRVEPGSDLGGTLPDVADLVAIVRQVDDLESIDAGRLAEGSFLFYGIVLPGPAGHVGFVKKTDPVTTLRKGRAYFRYADALVTTARPDLMLYGDVDMVVGPTDIAVFRKSALDQLLSDVRVVLQDVPANVGLVGTSLAAKVPLTAAARDSLEEYCSTRPSLAARLRLLPARIDQIKLTPACVRKALRRHGEDPSLLVNGSGEFDFAGEGVRAFLDVAEGRWFEDEFSSERRRADRYSIRKGAK
jgi:hypothetical protein